MIVAHTDWSAARPATREARPVVRLGRCLGATAVILLAVAWPAPAVAADVPSLSGRVVDDAKLLTPATREALTATLQAHERATGNQIAVLTVPTIGSQTVEEYATRVFDTWKLGQKGKDNGVLVVVALTDRRMRIQVGYGLESTLTDLAAGRIIRDVMTPPFKAGEYDKGVTEGVAAIVATLEGTSGPSAAASVSDRTEAQSSWAIRTLNLAWPARILVATFVLSMLGLFTFLGMMTTPGMGWSLYVFLLPFWALFPVMILGTPAALLLLGGYVAGYPIAKILLARSRRYRKVVSDLTTTGHAGIGRFLVTSGGSSGSTSGGDSGGFSGGGGDSGGGGASGSW